MDKLREEFIRAVMLSLKIEENPFIIATVDEYTKSIAPSNYKEFMTSLFGTQHSFLNGLDRVAKVAEQFKPEVVDEVEAQAKELIDLVYSMNATVFKSAEFSGRTFEDELKGTVFKNLDSEIVILDQVKPYCNHKQLVDGISCLSTSVEQTKAFCDAVNYSSSYCGMIENSRVKKMIGS